MEKKALQQMVKDLQSGEKRFVVYGHRLDECEMDCMARIINDEMELEYEDASYDCIDSVLEDAYEVMQEGEVDESDPDEEPNESYSERCRNYIELTKAYNH